MSASKSGSWRAFALCRQIDPGNLFYPEKGESPRPAKAVCARCPVTRLCLEDALTQPHAHDHGVWGGTTRKERVEIRRLREAAAEQSGREAA